MDLISKHVNHKAPPTTKGSECLILDLERYSKALWQIHQLFFKNSIKCLSSNFYNINGPARKNVLSPSSVTKIVVNPCTKLSLKPKFEGTAMVTFGAVLVMVEIRSSGKVWMVVE